MATKIHFVHLIHLLRRILSKSIKSSSVIPALKQVWRHLALYLSRLHSLLVPSTFRNLSNGSPSSPKGPIQPPDSLIGKSDGRGHEKESPNLAPELSYTYRTISNGGTISLSDIMPSIYPLSGSGIHNSSRTSMNLEASRLAHIATSRNASRSNLDATSQRAASVISRIDSGPEEGFTITVENPGSPTIPSPSPGDIPLTNLHTSYLHPADTPTRPSSPNALRSSNSSTVSLTLNADYRRPNSPALHVRSPGIASSRSSLSLTSGQTPGPVENLYSNANTSGVSVLLENGIERVVIAPSTTEIGEPSWLRPLATEHIAPIMPENLEHVRYRNRPTIRKEWKHFETPPCVLYTQEAPPEGWIKLTHPEGVRYFYHPEKRAYSDSNLKDEVIYKKVMEDIEILQQHRSACGLNQDFMDLIIYTKYRDGDPTRLSTFYYFIYHPYSSVFFLDNYKMESLAANKEIYGPTSWDHLRHEIEAQYWYHVQLYPHSRSFTRESIAELRDVILHFIGDSMTSPTSTAPYSMQDLRDILALTNDMEKNLGQAACVGAQSLLARQMFIFCRAKYLHFHGEPHARVERDVSVYGDDVHKRTWLVKTLSPILFFAPDFHLKNLQSMWVDGIMHKSVFRDAMKKMNEEWDHFVLFATVMLSANVGFLAIQSVDNNSSPQRSAAQISSYVSTFASIGSIVLGLHLSRQNKTKDRGNIENISEVQKYMTSRSRSTLGGLEILAILYSLPYALLIWGMVSFFIAVALVCFLDSDTPTRTIVGFCAASSLVLVYWCICTNWEQEDAKEDTDSDSTFSHSLRDDSAMPKDPSSSSLHKSLHSRSFVIETLCPTVSRQNSAEVTTV